MGIFRGKNAKLLTMMVVIAVIIVMMFIAVVQSKEKKAENEETTFDSSELGQVINKDLDKAYPASVREVMKFYCRILSCMFNEKVTDEQFAKLVDQERALFDDELLATNDYATFTDNQKAEITSFKGSKNQIINYQIEDNEEIKEWYNNENECASIVVRINISGSELIQKDQQFIFRRDEDNRWKILGWKEASTTGIEDEPSINDTASPIE